MNSITRETRRESYLKRPANRKIEILSVMGDREMTARQICAVLGAEDLNYVRPRLTEMLQRGEVETVGKVWDLATGRRVAQFRRVRKEEEEC